MRALVTKLLVGTSVGGVHLIHKWSKLIRKSRRSGSGPRRVVMIGSFDSSGWLMAHAGPLAESAEVEEVWVLSDKKVEVYSDNIFFYCPSPMLVRLVGKSAARLFTLIRAGFELRPMLFMGYHIMPNAPMALLASTLFGGASAYQMTGGPDQILDGGCRSENPWLRATGDGSKWLEGVLAGMVRRFDFVIVRGEKSRRFIEQNKLSKRCEVITGAIDIEKFYPGVGMRWKFDVITVTRLVPKTKGVERFLEVIANLKARIPDIRAVIVGDGPARVQFEELSRSHDIEDNVRFVGRMTDVSFLLRDARVFSLLSPSEGMSIAMLEAMASGLPVVVTDVGELGDAVRQEGGGVLVDFNSPEDPASAIHLLLQDDADWQRLSSTARRTIVGKYSCSAIANRWNKILSDF